MLLERVLAVIVGLGWVYWLVACWLVRSFFRSAAGRRPLRPFLPPVSILKPVRGLDHEAFENFDSFCHQDYPNYEIIFGVDDPHDPAVPVIRRLQRTRPDIGIRLVVARIFAANRKACLLHALAGKARHGVLVMSDSDMRVTPDYLRRVVAPLADPGVGLVTCPYVGDETLSLSAGLEALHMGMTFLPSVVVARKVIRMKFALGASIAIRGGDLERLGGFASLSDYLAEDYQLGARISDLGLRVCLSDYVIRCAIGATTLHEQWDREVRWARCTRVSRPKEYPGLVFSFSTAVAGFLAWLTGFDPAYLQAFWVSLILRWVVGWFIAGYAGDRVGRRWLIWLPVRDLMSGLTWLAGGVGRRVTWRGSGYRLLKGGRIRPLAPHELEPPVEPIESEGGETGDGLESGGEGLGLPPPTMLRHP